MVKPQPLFACTLEDCGSWLGKCEGATILRVGKHKKRSGCRSTSVPSEVARQSCHERRFCVAWHFSFSFSGPSCLFCLRNILWSSSLTGLRPGGYHTTGRTGGNHTKTGSRPDENHAKGHNAVVRRFPLQEKEALARNRSRAPGRTACLPEAERGGWLTLYALLRMVLP